MQDAVVPYVQEVLNRQTGAWIAVMAERQFARAPTSRLRLKGYRSALTAAGLSVDPQLIGRVAHLRRQDGAEAMARLLDLRHPPDAVFCLNDLMAWPSARYTTCTLNT